MCAELEGGVRDRSSLELMCAGHLDQAHNEKLASLLLEENPAARLKAQHVS